MIHVRIKPKVVLLMNILSNTIFFYFFLSAFSLQSSSPSHWTCSSLWPSGTVPLDPLIKLTRLVAGTRSTSPSPITSGSPWRPAFSCGGPPSSSSCWRSPLSTSSFRSLSQCSYFCWATCTTFWGNLIPEMRIWPTKCMMSGLFCMSCSLTMTSSVQKGRMSSEQKGRDSRPSGHRNNHTTKETIITKTFRL